MMMLSRLVSRRTTTTNTANILATATARNVRSITSYSQLSEETTMVYEMCRKFADEELTPKAREWDQTHSFPTQAILQLSELGLMGINTPMEQGGSGLDALSYAIAMEEISRGCASTGVIMSAHNSLYLSPVQTFGTPAQQEQYITPFAFPSLSTTDNTDKITNIGCFCLSEPGNGSDAGAATTTAILDGDSGDWILNGTKACLLYTSPSPRDGILSRMPSSA